MFSKVCYFVVLLSVFVSAYGSDQSVLELKETLSVRVGSLCEKSVIAVFQAQLKVLGPSEEGASRHFLLNAVQEGLGDLATSDLKTSILTAAPQGACTTLPIMARLNFEPVLEEAARLLDSSDATRDALLCSCKKTKNLLLSLEKEQELVQPIPLSESAELDQEFRSMDGSVTLLLSSVGPVFRRDEVVLRASLRSFELADEAYRLVTSKGVTAKDIEDFEVNKLEPAQKCWWQSISVLQNRTAYVDFCEGKIAQCAGKNAAAFLEGLNKNFTPCYEVKDNPGAVISEISKLRQLMNK